MRSAVRQGLGAAAIAAGALGCGRGPTAVPAPRCGAGICDWTPLAGVVDSAVREGVAPGAVVAVSLDGGRFFHAAGRIGFDDTTGTGPRTVYDLASLTKVVGLTTMAMFAVDQGRLDLDAPVSRYLPSYAVPPKDRVTIRHLLTHSSGLPADRRLWLEAPTADSAIALVLATPLGAAPGTRTLYSDLGAITLTQIIEGIYRRPIDRLFQEWVARPLRLESTRFRPPASWLGRIAPTERDPWRGRVVRGEVHDEKAAFLGGVSGHAGLFSDATDLLAFGEWLLDQRDPTGRLRRGRRISSSVVREFTRRQALVPGASRALGWDTPSEGSSAGTRLAPTSFGHTGFTGTSIWLDPTRRLVVVLLTNRVNPTRDNPRIFALRPLVANRVVEVVDGAR